MSIDVKSANTVEVGYDEFCGALAAHDLQALWSLQRKIMPDVPLPSTQPWLWKWDTVFPLAKRAGEIITIERGGDRRVLALANPGLNGLPFTSTTLWGAIQYLGPGESAPAHRHTPSAIRFVMTGSSVYTTVDGDACEMEAGDLILTPNWKWHDHNNYGDEPMVWFDGLDLPLMVTLESIFFENHPDLQQQVRGHGLSEQLYSGPGLAPAGDERDPLNSPLLRYSWANTERQLEAMHERLGGHQVTVEYLNPATGGPAIRTFACEMTRLFPGARTPTRRTTGSSVHVVFQGSGRSVIDGTVFEWGPGDMFVVPSWAAVDHEASEQSDHFVISDRPVLEAFRLFRREELPEHQAVGRLRAMSQPRYSPSGIRTARGDRGSARVVGGVAGALPGRVERADGRLLGGVALRRRRLDRARLRPLQQLGRPAVRDEPAAARGRPARAHVLPARAPAALRAGAGRAARARGARRSSPRCSRRCSRPARATWPRRSATRCRRGRSASGSGCRTRSGSC